MAELSAKRDLDSATSETARDEAITELRAASIAKVQQLNAIRGRLMLHARRMVAVSQRIGSAGGIPADDAKALEHAAQGMETLLEVLAAEGAQQPEQSQASTPAEVRAET